MKKSQRSTQLELIDLGHYTKEEYEDCLYQLDRIGRLLGGDRATYWGFDRLRRSPRSILDVGCGGGLFAVRLAKRYPKAQILGIDLNQQAIQLANRSLELSDAPLNLRFSVPASPRLNYAPKSFDVVTATLVCHHLTDPELIQFLKQAYSIAKQAIILNDLHRHQLATMAFSTIAPLIFCNRLISHDGCLSIKRSFKRKEWISLLQAANIPLNRCSITWHWAFRWIILIDSSEEGSL